MPEGIDASSFEFYEGIRIFVPGALALGLAIGVGDTFSIKALDVTHNSLAALFIAFAAGLLFYFIDAPARAAVFFPFIPSDTIDRWEFGTRYEKKYVVNRYLLLLDEGMPASVRARALYMGSMYRVGFEAVYLLLLTSLGVFLVPGFTTQGAASSPHGLTLFWVVLSAGISGWVFCIYRYLKGVDAAARRRGRRPNPRNVRWSKPDYTIQAIAWVVFLGLAARRSDLQAWVFSVPPLVLASLWAFRYFKGYSAQGRGLRAEGRYLVGTWRRLIAERHVEPTDNSGRAMPPNARRKPIDAVHAIQLAGSVAALSVLTEAFSPRQSLHHLEANMRIGWGTGLLVGLLLIVGRGHERRLGGAYATQNTWLQLNKQRVLERYFLAPGVTPLPEPGSTGPQSASATRPPDIPPGGEL